MEDIFTFFLMSSLIISHGCSMTNSETLEPSLQVTILVSNKAHTLPYFLTLLDQQDYPKDRISLYIRSDHNVDISAKILDLWLSEKRHLYHSVNSEIDPEILSQKQFNHSVFEWNEKRFRRLMKLKEDALDEARRIWADFVLFVDADVFLTNNQTFRQFTHKDLTVAGPLLKTLSSYSNFWGGMTDSFYYNRTEDYFPILDRERIGCFPVAMVHSCFFINLNRAESRKLNFLSEKIENYQGPEDDIISFAISAKTNKVPMNICNLEKLSEYGYLMNPMEPENELEDDYHNLVNLKLLIYAQTSVLRVDPIFANFLLRTPTKDKMNMDQIYMINLKRRGDRKAKMDACFTDLGISYKLVEAVDGRKINEEYLQENQIEMMPLYQDPYHKRPMKYGEIGCFMSHYQIWQDVIKNGYEKVIVFEDDILFEPNFREKHEDLMAEMAELKLDWDLVYLGRKIMHNTNDVWVPKSKQLVSVDYTYWTLAYMLTLEGAKKLVEEEPLSKMVPVDEYLPIMYDRHPNPSWKEFYKNRNLKAFSAAPRLVYPTHYTGEKGYVSDTEDTTVMAAGGSTGCGSKSCRPTNEL